VHAPSTCFRLPFGEDGLPLLGEHDPPKQGRGGRQATTTIREMPLLLRHLAAAVLPLAAATAGVVAVGIAVHLPAGLLGHVSVQAVVPPVGAAASVVARVGPGRERRPARPTPPPSPTRAPLAARAPFTRVAGSITVAAPAAVGATPEPPEPSPQRPLPPDEAAPLMPPVAPPPTPQPVPAPDLAHAFPPAPVEQLKGRKQKHAGKESHRDQRRHVHGVRVVLSTEPSPDGEGEGGTTHDPGTDGEEDTVPGHDDDLANASDADSAKAGDKRNAKANESEKGDQNGDGHSDGNGDANGDRDRGG